MLRFSIKKLLSFQIPINQIQKITTRSSGPGGQSVNKAETKVQLRFNVDKAEWIPLNVKNNLKKIFKNKLSKTNDLIIECEETSSQMSNYKICFDKLTKILEEAENYKEKVKYTNIKEFIHLIKTDDQIKKYKDKLINQKKKKREKKFNKRDYD
ncbi:peptidyl-tRNA hydrolase ICT1, putative [Plasmodium berghei]|uniref:Peptidyl-tRNA hydrolase ICT1, putative n=2 Tax=Plasmodium berghei TaxID=5821 RepID=A0A509AMC0_PLABA|nr:peptidyl-tRNA hydrolase ICT1, putative [Plasmodium berghei ANKA]CXI44411.1 peptidyl-tRNA hydrolase ICT1, putative [Plasmodium berghei]SCM22500.1 peptidyl-tRNA hydrolase ICT1, putative [Plasmodium berghei]SCN25487.1 peptidyl-tRNA hydrolase ICT1, putative [Plasmodium berghei]SCO60446.1 peptidyl-tRNA hydrolase ICT1, putative [Plasmodium berghei]SCO62240.1 peptidyl-tRNA hydrolase ICT1, putative [Plasmodium berghei]|eukprot:XP_034421654.1 peptidyl-tRNA hydrolase ICT1, putative [Plasmodium berghei ANKA]